MGSKLGQKERLTCDSIATGAPDSPGGAQELGWPFRSF